MKQRQRKSQYTKREKQRTYSRANKPAKEDNLQQAIVYLQGVEESHRQEILQDVQSRRSLVLANLSVAGVFISAALVNFDSTGIIAYVYPIIGYYLSIEWRRDNDKIATNKWYIREMLEKIVSKILKKTLQGFIPWEVLQRALSEMKPLLLLKKEISGASLEEILRLSDVQERMIELLELPAGEPVPQSFIDELRYQYHAKASHNLVEDGARGVFVVLEVLATVLATTSCILRELQPPYLLPYQIGYAVVGLSLLVIDVIYIVKTRRLIKHERR